MYTLLYHMKAIRAFGMRKMRHFVIEPVEPCAPVIPFSPLLHIKVAGKAASQ